ncbi:MAG: DUF2683 family protein [Pedobacter sp.]|uniref:DUF2683 family protein n=1 Tax=Pedobacter sp. TaxID=1411316 RepID=UPI003568522A
MGTLIVHPKNKEQLSVLKAFMKALKISFEESKSDLPTYSSEVVSENSQVKEVKEPYNKNFLNKINKSEDEFKSGKFTAIKTKDLWK